MPRRERPLDEGESGLLRFAADLRRLREWAGSPTYRELARRAHYSAAALSEAAGGRKLPSLAVTRAYAKACKADPDEWERRWRAVADTQPQSTGDSPYVGLAMFQPDDAPKFFGRERLTVELLTTTNRFTGVFGPSGVGKSSLLRAGLMARTHEDTLLFTPGANPREECAIALARLYHAEAFELADELADPRKLRQHHDGLVVVDQFEELFTLCPNEEQRTWLIEALTGCRKVVIGVRADYYGHCAQYPELVEALRNSQVMVGAMTPDELRLAITEPAAHVGAKVETALLARLMADAVGQAAVLPLLSHALKETWQHRRGMTLTLTAYEEIGGLEHAVARTAQELYDGFTTNQQHQAKRILLRLITAEDTKRRARKDELEADEDVLFALAAARLIVIDRDGVELAHEALIRSWPMLHRWVEENRENIKAQREVTYATQTWESLDRDAGALLRGKRLANASNKALSLNSRERAFLAASLAAEEEVTTSARRRTRRHRQLLTALVTTLVVAASSTVFALQASKSAAEQRTTAAVLKAIGEAAALRPANPALAQQIALAAYQLVPLPQARNSLRQEDVPSQGLRQAETEVTALVVGPTQQQVATGHRDGTVVLTDLDDLPSPRGSHTATTHSSSVTAIAMDPAGGLIASISEDGAVHLVDISLGRPRDLGALPARATAIAWQGTTLVTTDTDGALSFWTDLRGERPRLLATSQLRLGPLAGMAFRADGKIMVAVTTGRAAHLVDVSDAREVKPLALTKEFAGSAQFAGNDLLMTTDGNAVHLWDTTDPRDPALRAEISSGGGEVTATWLSANGLAVATDDGLVRLWRLGEREPVELALLRGHAGPVTAVGLTPKGDEVVTGGADRAVRLWTVDLRDPAVRICQQAYPRMTAQDWDRYFGELDFKPPCPE